MVALADMVLTRSVCISSQKLIFSRERRRMVGGDEG